MASILDIEQGLVAMDYPVIYRTVFFHAISNYIHSHKFYNAGIMELGDILESGIIVDNSSKDLSEDFFVWADKMGYIKFFKDMHTIYLKTCKQDVIKYFEEDYDKKFKHVGIK